MNDGVIAWKDGSSYFYMSYDLSPVCGGAASQ